MNTKAIILLATLSAGQAFGAANPMPAPMEPDYDGNGISDVMFYGEGDTPGQADIFVDCRGVNGAGTPQIDRRHIVSELARTTWEVTLGDFDGDGQDDIFLFDRVTRDTGKAHLIRITPDCHTRSSVTLAEDWNINWEIYPGDYDGDGADDLFLFDRTGAKGVGHIVRFDTNGQIIENKQVTPGWRNTWEIYPGDYDADGADGLFMFDRVDGVAHLVRFDVNGDIYSSHPVGGTYHPATEFYRGDFDGDGGYDLFTLNHYQSHAGAIGRILRFDDIGYIEADVPVSNTLSPFAAPTVGDFTGDGAADLYLHYDNGTSASAYMLTFDGSARLVSFNPLKMNVPQNALGFAGEMDGLPGADLFSIKPPSQYNAATASIYAFNNDGSFAQAWWVYILGDLDIMTWNGRYLEF